MPNSACRLLGTAGLMTNSHRLLLIHSPRGMALEFCIGPFSTHETTYDVSLNLLLLCMALISVESTLHSWNKPHLVVVMFGDARWLVTVHMWMELWFVTVKNWCMWSFSFFHTVLCCSLELEISQLSLSNAEIMGLCHHVWFLKQFFVVIKLCDQIYKLNHFKCTFQCY
jgi:hypothetical protein